MPRAFHEITRWDGGLNTHFDESDIDSIELADISLWSISKPGRIYTIPSFIGTDGYSSRYNENVFIGTSSNNVLGRYGFIIFDSDYSIASPAALTATRYAAVIGVDGKMSLVAAFTSASNTVTNLTSTIGTAATRKPRMFWADGALRISDTTHSAGSQVMWYGIVSYERFTNADDAWLNARGSAGLTGSEWITANASQPSPACNSTVGDPDTASNILHGQVFMGRTADSYPVATVNRGKGLNLNISASTTAVDGGWVSTTYEFGQSLVYVGGQESLVNLMPLWDVAAGATGHDVVLAEQQYFTNIRVFAGADDTNNYGKRVIGARIYIRKKGQNKRWVLFLDCDFQRGVRRNTFDAFDSDWEKGSTSNYRSLTELIIKSPSPQTYESLNGYSPKDAFCSFESATTGWEDSTVSNRRCFLVGVKYYDSYSGQLELKSDRVYYSALAKYDTYPTSNWIDLGINDGESFTAVDGFANRILAFKQGTLYIINIQNPNDGGWFLEAELKGMGVGSPDAVTKSEQGIIFANKYGLYQFTGQGIPKPLNGKVDKTAWVNDLSEDSHYIQIGYDGTSEQCIVGLVSETGAGASTSSNPHYVYDFRTKGMTRHQDLMTDGRTNYSNIPDTGELVWIEPLAASPNFTISKYSSNDLGVPYEVDLTSQYFTTRLTDFGAPSLLKRFYNLYIDLKTSGTSDFDIIINGEAAIQFTETEVSSYTKKKFSLSAIPDSSTFQLKILNHAVQSISINNISLEYRVLHKRVI